MRKAVALVAGLLVLAFVNYGIYGRERLVREGRVVVLRLAPVDPRSLMQGDYMRLRFEAADQAQLASGADSRADGRIVLALDANNVGTYRRIDDGRPLGPGEAVIRYRIRNGWSRLATDSFFFEEGQAETYAHAQYGAFRVAPDGEAILTGLRGPHLEPLGPQAVR
ncbi:MAG TPA: GDYXXLXY domain-containing protein [Allosphingosinicella sp.]|nr:GDYXXLXY domain-containing protein [Allosphingosinicella sp.]